MTLDQHAELAAAGESETLEFKETTGTRREGARTVCAFLNQRGGQVLFGVTRSGVVLGQQVSERTIEELSAELQQIDPPAFPTIERVRVDSGREVIVVGTSHGPVSPYSYRGSAYRRVGNTTVAMSADEYSRMLFERMHSEQRWENQPATGWSINDRRWGRFGARPPRRSEAAEWRSLRVGSRRICCADSGFCVTARC